jgi:hypothetical protein
MKNGGSGFTTEVLAIEDESPDTPVLFLQRFTQDKTYADA